MARPIVLSNGNLHVGLNKFAEVHDFYYPYVGLENHAAAKMLRHRIGVWIDGTMSWLDDGTWQFHFDYHHKSLIGSTKAHNPHIQVSLEFDDTVDFHHDVFLRNIHVINHSNEQREIRLFMHQVFDIGDGAGNGDSAQYLPDSQAILHYRGNRAFVISGQQHYGGTFDEYSIGLFGIEGHQGTFVDAEDGVLSQNNVEHGRVDSVISFHLSLKPHESGRVHYWLAAGTSMREALFIHELVKDHGMINRLMSTSQSWHSWLAPAKKTYQKLPADQQELFIKSLLLVKSHIDNRGGVIASTDTTMLNYSRDAYSYCWPRDGAYAIWPLIRLGYSREPLLFFDFCKRVMHPKGYLMHKYQADGALGSSWHPYIHPNNVIAPPIQLDETAIVLFIFSQFYEMQNDKTSFKKYYKSLVKPMAAFLESYIEEKTGLPRASYDLWEEQFMTTTYTTAVVYGALMAAAKIAEDLHENQDAVQWRTTAEDIQMKAQHTLYNDVAKCFYKGIRVQKDIVEYDETIDSSAVYGAFMFGLFELDSPQLRHSVQTAHRALSLPQETVKGLARYQNDRYVRANPTYVGNPWFITTFWFAQYYLEVNDIAKAQELTAWCETNMLTSGVLSEQLNPDNQQFVSVAPLTWSHAEYLNTLLDHAEDSHAKPTT